ncbi:MAG TPA: adenylate/guanylate cyclase domain-containing protein, partial [Novosphingobium sp.]|nr:adenylate/guanylate cyclase domain-containing protein [Novosphingobium sp.]
VAYSWYVGRPGYPTSRFADLALFVCAQPGMYVAARAFAATGASDWTLGTLLCYNVMVALAFACLCFAASVRRFFALSLASVVYLLAVLLAHGEGPTRIFYTGVFYGAYAVLMFYLNWAIDDKARALYSAGITIAAEREKSDRLLENILPKAVAERLRSGEAVADEFPEVAIVFVDVVGFTTLAKTLPAERVVDLLNAFFSHADRGVDLFGLDKVKTIGDAYMAVAGAMTRPPRPAKAALDFACYLIEGANELGTRFGVDFRLHVGINSGPVIGGVISAKRISYDYWGDTINLASRLQDVAGANGVAVSEATWRLVNDAYAFAEPRQVPLKGMGEVPVYDLAPSPRG